MAIGSHITEVTCKILKVWRSVPFAIRPKII